MKVEVRDGLLFIAVGSDYEGCQKLESPSSISQERVGQTPVSVLMFLPL